MNITLQCQGLAIEGRVLPQNLTQEVSYNYFVDPLKKKIVLCGMVGLQVFILILLDDLW